MNTKTKKAHRASYPAPAASSAPAKATWKKRPAPVVGGRRNVIERRRPGAARGPDHAVSPPPAGPAAPTLAERAQAAEAARRAAAEAKKAAGSDKPWWKRKAPVVGGSNPRPKPGRPHQTRPAVTPAPANDVDEAFDGSDELDDLAGELE